MTKETSPAITGVRTIGVPVSDQDQALDFYTERLGFQKQVDVPMEQFGARWIEVGPADSTVTVALVPAREGIPSGVETGIRLTVPDAGAAHAALGADGGEVGELLEWPGAPPMFKFRDQDGNGLEIVEQT